MSDDRTHLQVITDQLDAIYELLAQILEYLNI
jgi:hypothetical protein